LKLGSKAPLNKLRKLESKPKERTWTVLKFTEGLGLTEVGTKVFEGTDWHEQRAATAALGIVRVLA
jgi:hypothetical protein